MQAGRQRLNRDFTTRELMFSMRTRRRYLYRPLGIPCPLPPRPSRHVSPQVQQSCQRLVVLPD